MEPFIKSLEGNIQGKKLHFLVHGDGAMANG